MRLSMLLKVELEFLNGYERRKSMYKIIQVTSLYIAVSAMLLLAIIKGVLSIV